MWWICEIATFHMALCALFRSGSRKFLTLTSVGCFQNLLRCDWSPDGRKVTAGSSDRYVYIWDTTSRRILYKLPGHAGSVNDCRFHPTEPICEYPDFSTYIELPANCFGRARTAVA